jgi:hypothetical protein
MPSSKKIIGVPQGGTLQPLPSEIVATATKTDATPAIRARSREEVKRQTKRVELSDAMRAHGIDEDAIAGQYVRVMARLTKGNSQHCEKLIIDVLKEVTRVLDPEREGGPRRDDAGRFVAVQLIHNVPRPVRGETPAKATS